jgi:hypothetical protein
VKKRNEGMKERRNEGREEGERLPIGLITERDRNALREKGQKEVKG